MALEAGATVLAPRLTAVCLRACAIHTRRDTLAPASLSQDRGDRRRRVQRGLARQPANPRGTRRQQREANRQDPGGLCLDDPTMPPTHHASAPAIRRRTVVRKVTHEWRSDGGRDWLAAVRRG